MMVGSLCALYLGLLTLVQVSHVLAKLVESLIGGGRCCNGDYCGDTSEERQWNSQQSSIYSCRTTKKIRDTFHYTLLSAGVVSLLIHVVHALHLAVVFRKHMLRLLGGKGKVALGMVNLRPLTAATGSIKYVAFQIVFLFTGWIAATIAIELFFGAVIFVIVLPIMDVYDAAVLKYLVRILLWDDTVPGAVTLYIMTYVATYILVRLTFGSGAHGMAVQRRIFYMNLDFFQLSFSLLMGFFSYLQRILIALLFALFFSGRLDKSLLPRGYELWDSGYAAYVDCLKLELHYGNPVLLTFADLLARERSRTPLARKRWLRAYTLLRNAHHLLATSNDNLAAARASAWKADAEDPSAQSPPPLGPIHKRKKGKERKER